LPRDLSRAAGGLLMDAAVLRQIGHSLFVAELPDPLPGQTSTKKFLRGRNRTASTKFRCRGVSALT
jgi:hypothetical protein